MVPTAHVNPKIHLGYPHDHPNLHLHYHDTNPVSAVVHLQSYQIRHEEDIRHGHVYFCQLLWSITN